MKIKINNIFLILLLLLNICKIFAQTNQDFYPQYLPIENKFCPNKINCIYLEVARSLQEQKKGLMFRPRLNDDHGMLFILDNQRKISIWMRNTLIPLDLIFISNSKIVNLYKNVPPCPFSECKEYQSITSVDSIIELNAGTIDKHNISLGQVIKIEEINKS